jgi:putative phosphoesterase
MQIAIIADTHMPRGTRRLPATCLDRLSQADLIVHAGDLSTLEVLRELEEINPVIAVQGNVDDERVRSALPQTAHIQLDHGLTLAVIHDAGPRTGRLQRLRRRFPIADAVIFGHSHLPLHEESPDGFQIFNPGSPTERRRAPHHTMGAAHTDSRRIEFELLEVG